MNPVITLLTDFGTDDSYVGVMKGVMLGICPEARLVDITHAIPPQDVAAAMRVVPTYLPYFPVHTVHLVVVDPGVGSMRKPIACNTPMGYLVGPDNGVFSLALQQAQRIDATAVQAVALNEPRFWLPRVSTTFHGRDLFAPVSAYLAAGVPFERVGAPVDTLVTLTAPEPLWKSRTHLIGEVVAVDHFGNCISNITNAHLRKLGARQALKVVVNERQLAIVNAYADVAPGEPLAIVGSDNYLEVSIREGSACTELSLTRGARLQVLLTQP